MLALEFAEQLHTAGIQITSEKDSRGVALVRAPHLPGLTALDELVTMLMTIRVQAHMLELQKQAAATAAAASEASAP